ncbi:hypothetical protein BU15DRAFT_64162 [Melanogaster broomeanus]|nr:hypothetical protein BU15DRAFT_64162 [Melanogaster broomeanus]
MHDLPPEHPDCHAGHGPSMVKQMINSRALNIKYVKEFSRQAKVEGLHNKIVEYAIIIGIQKEWINLDFMEPIHGGMYENCMDWNPRHFSNTNHSLLFNGNHYMHYIQTDYASCTIYQLYLHAKEGTDDLYGHQAKGLSARYIGQKLQHCHERRSLASKIHKSQ